MIEAATPNTSDEHDRFYSEITASSEAFIPPEVQEAFRNSSILVAGAGSIGNPIAMMSVRSGAERITVLDPDVVEVSNLPRQEYTYDQIGTNKAESTRQNILAVNPFVQDTVCAESQGLTTENVRHYVSRADIIIDAIDIRALDMIMALHREAAALSKPVLVGYDLAGTAMIAVYRYDIEDIDPLRGALTEKTIAEFHQVRLAFDTGEISEPEFLNYIHNAFVGPIPPLLVPFEQLQELLMREPDDTRTYQLGTTSRALSALAVETMRRILAGERVRSIISIDLPSTVRQVNPLFVSKIHLLVRLLLKMKRQNDSVNSTVQSLNLSTTV